MGVWEFREEGNAKDQEVMPEVFLIVYAITVTPISPSIAPLHLFRPPTSIVIHSSAIYNGQDVETA